MVITNPDGSTPTLSGGFNVTNGGAPQISVEVVGLNKIRVGRAQPYYVVVSNSGNVDASYVPIWLSFPNFLTYGAVDPSRTLPSLVGTNTVLTSDVFALPAGASGVLPISLTAPTSTPFQIRSWTIDLPDSVATNTSSLNAQTGSRFSGWREALDAILHWVLDVSPYAIEEPAGVVVDIGVHLPQLGICGVIAAVSLKQSALGITDLNSVPEILPFDDPRWNTLGSVLAQLQAAAGNAGLVCGTAPINPPTLPVQPVSSLDPNEKVGSRGIGTQQYITGLTPLRYSVYFANQDTATATAQEVAITDQLDTTRDNLGTFSLGPISFGSQLLTPPPFQTTFSTTVDLRPTTNLFVAVNSTLNTATGLLAWTFQSLDPVTNQPPTDPTVGFLPPGGNGSVFFTVNPKQALTTNTQIENQATIVFDVNAPIITPTWLNTLDNTPPRSQVSALPTTEATASFAVNWSGSDVGSGVATFKVYFSDNGGPFTTFQIDTAAKSATFAGQAGHTYGFYSIATDAVGNVEAPKTAPEATTTMALALVVSAAQVSTTASGLAYSRASQLFNGTVTIRNISSNTINGPLEVVLTALPGGVILVNASGSFGGSPYLAVPSVNNLAPGQSATVTVQFKNPSNAKINFTPVIYSGSLN